MKRTVIVASVTLIASLVLWFEPTGVARGILRGEPRLDGRPSSVWAQGLVDDNPLRQKQTLESLQTKGAESLPVLVGLIQHPTPEVRWRAAEILGVIGDAASATPMGRLIDDPDPHVRIVAVRSLGLLSTRHPTAVHELSKALTGTLALEAVKALAAVGGAARPIVFRITPLLGDENSELRWNAAKTLGKMGPDAVDAVDPLIHALADSEPLVREHAAESLGYIGPAAIRAIPKLITAAQDENAKVRRDAIRSLGAMGPAAKDALPVLKAAVNDSYPKARDAAVVAIKLIETPSK